MESLFVRVLTLSLTGSAVLLPLLLLAPRLRGRYAAGTLSVLWLVLALRMALPVPLSLPWTAVTVDVSALSSVTLPAAPRAPAEVPEPAGPESVEPPRAVPPAAAPEGRPLPLLELAAWVWLAGGLALVGYQGAAYLLARRRLLRGAQPGTEEESGGAGTPPYAPPAKDRGGGRPSGGGTWEAGASAAGQAPPGGRAGGGAPPRADPPAAA